MRLFLWSLIILAVGLNLPALLSAAVSEKEEGGDKRDSNYFLPPDTIEKKIEEERAFKKHGKRKLSETEVDVMGDAADNVRVVDEAKKGKVGNDKKRKLPPVINTAEDDEDIIEVAKSSKKGNKMNSKEDKDIKTVKKTKMYSEPKSTVEIAKGDLKKKSKYDSDSDDYEGDYDYDGEDDVDFDDHDDGYYDGSDDEYGFDEDFYGKDGDEDSHLLYDELYGDNDYSDAMDGDNYGGDEYAENDD